MSFGDRCTITIDNGTGHHLQWLKHDLLWGKFSQGSTKDIKPGASHGRKTYGS